MKKSMKIYQGYKELRQKTRHCAALNTYEFTPMWKVILYMHIMGGSRKFCRGGGGGGIFSPEDISQRVVQISPEKQLDLGVPIASKGSNCFSRVICTSISKETYGYL